VFHANATTMEQSLAVSDESTAAEQLGETEAHPLLRAWVEGGG
jgi:hypothetical protein